MKTTTGVFPINHYPRHIGDFVRDTVGLTLAERGAYTALLDQYYAKEEPLPLDPLERYRMVEAKGKVDRVAVDYVVRKFFIEKADGWHQKRADREIAAYLNRAEKARSNGRHGGRPHNPAQTNPVLSGLPKHNPELTQTKASHKPVTNNQRSKTKPSSATPPDLPVSAELWEQFRESRRKLKAAMTPYAETLLINELCKIQSLGGDPTATVEQSIKRGWKGFFHVDSSSNGKGQTLAEKRSANMDEITGRTKRERTIDAAGSVDRAPIRPALGDLRESDDNDVG